MSTLGMASVRAVARGFTLALLGTAVLVAQSSAQQSKARPPKPPSKQEVDRGAASASANNGAPFEFKVSGAKAGSASGRDASYCVSAGPLKNSQIFALSMVDMKWAISITAMRPLPPVGKHAINGDLMEGIMADLIDKTTGPQPTDWQHRDVQAGTLTITTSSPSRLAGTFEITARSEGGELRAIGKFEAVPTKC